MKSCISSNGFTLIETMIASFISTLALAAATTLSLFYLRSQHEISLQTAADHTASMALTRLTYGMGENYGGLRSAHELASQTTTDGWQLSFFDRDGDAFSFEYVAGDRAIYFSDGGSHRMTVATDIETSPQPIINDGYVSLTNRVVLQRGRSMAARELGTTIRLRN